jgi:hypothetical protein
MHDHNYRGTPKEGHRDEVKNIVLDLRKNLSAKLKKPGE